ncbi:MAG: DNA recombination protein RmuC, partial [Paludibacteraceae bacterium]|nr:DNA recombination protein RmuC [Paludibacteraceae bacterium]
ELMKPIKEQFEAFQKSIEEAKNKNEVNKKEITTSFENTLKSFQEHQDMTVKHLSEQTEKIGNDATNLTKALKGESKTQGDWGEMILETMLENSGLRKDEEYFIQENVKDEEGKNFRPDVVVRFPEGRSIVIDSKVSLTAYADAVAAEDEATKALYMKKHVESIEKHVEELANKDYRNLVDGAIGYVLMFVPNESSYIAAMKQAPSLSAMAYKKRIIIISPSNLMMALQLAFNLWQADRQSKNVEEIVKKAGALYDKVVGFQDSFDNIGDYIGKLTKSFEEAKKRLYEGNANILRQTETLKELGVTPKKQLKLEE